MKVWLSMSYCSSKPHTSKQELLNMFVRLMLKRRITHCFHKNTNCSHRIDAI